MENAKVLVRYATKFSNSGPKCWKTKMTSGNARGSRMNCTMMLGGEINSLWMKWLSGRHWADFSIHIWNTLSLTWARAGHSTKRCSRSPSTLLQEGDLQNPSEFWDQCLESTSVRYLPDIIRERTVLLEHSKGFPTAEVQRLWGREREQTEGLKYWSEGLGRISEVRRECQ